MTICATTGKACFACNLAGIELCPALPGGYQRLAALLIANRRLTPAEAAKLVRSIDAEHPIVKRPGTPTP